jgi:hypothetical protein
MVAFSATQYRRITLDIEIIIFFIAETTLRLINIHRLSYQRLWSYYQASFSKVLSTSIHKFGRESKSYFDNFLFKIGTRIGQQRKAIKISCCRLTPLILNVFICDNRISYPVLVMDEPKSITNCVQFVQNPAILLVLSAKIIVSNFPSTSRPILID